jgi:hypothetical protein
MSTDRQYFRRKAQETMILARRTKDADNKAYLLSVAQWYEELALEAELKG